MNGEACRRLLRLGVVEPFEEQSRVRRQRKAVPHEPCDEGERAQHVGFARGVRAEQGHDLRSSLGSALPQRRQPLGAAGCFPVRAQANTLRGAYVLEVTDLRAVHTLSTSPSFRKLGSGAVLPTKNPQKIS